MPNSEEHQKIAVITGSLNTFIQNIINLYTRKTAIDINEFVKDLTINCIGAIFGTKLPDFFEPSQKNPNHRSVFHSITFVGFLIIGTTVINKNTNINPELKKFLNASVWGYSSHLLADFTTTKGLPFL